MPDGSISVRLPASATPVSAGAYDELAHASALDRVTAQMDRDGRSHEEIEAVDDERYTLLSSAVTRTPASLADAAAILLVAMTGLRKAVNVPHSRIHHLDDYLALGRVTRFLADEAGVDVKSLCGEEMITHCVDGIDPQMAAEVWLEEAMDARVTVMLNNGHPAVYCPEREKDADLQARRADVARRFSDVDKACLRRALRVHIWSSPYGVAGGRAMDDGNWIFNLRRTQDGDEIMIIRAGGTTMQVPVMEQQESVEALSQMYITAMHADRVAYLTMTEEQAQQRSKADVAALFDGSVSREDLLLRQMAAIPARSPAALRAKARALWWMYGGDDVVPAFDLGMRRQDALLDSLLRDLINPQSAGAVA